MGRLLRNTLGWLASSPDSSGIGGFVTPAERWQLPNMNPNVAKQFAEKSFDYNPSALDGVDPATPHGTLYRGLIGARTSISDGSGSVKDYADAAKAHGVDFIVFLETFAMAGNQTFSVGDLKRLKADCAAHSDSSVQLYPGFAIENQFGQQMMVIGTGIDIPDPDVLTSDGRRFEVVLLHRQPLLAGTSIGMERGRQQINGLADARSA